MESLPLRTALVSVWNKNGLEPLARLLVEKQVQFYSTGGTATFLKNCGANVIEISDLTGFPEMLEGRVKTLHPAVFGGILARRDCNNHLQTLHSHRLPLIDLVIVDLYPFEETLATGAALEEMIEKIDVGGVALLRAAAKNHAFVRVLPGAKYYDLYARLLNEIPDSQWPEVNRKFAALTFKLVSSYDAIISDYLAQQTSNEMSKIDFPEIALIHTTKTNTVQQQLRYGENPHQEAFFEGSLEMLFDKLQGKELSYNNLLDLDSAFRLLQDFVHLPITAIFKHTNVCGIAGDVNGAKCWEKALACDPESAFGGIIATNQVVDKAMAESIVKVFFEVLLAPGFTPEARQVFEHQNRVLLQYKKLPVETHECRTLLGGKLVQRRDSVVFLNHIEDADIVTPQKPTAEALADLDFAFRVAKSLKSNAIAIVKDKQLIGSGAGQTSRVEAVRQAIQKAQKLGFDLSGSVLASDGFFPFPDSVALAAAAGVKAFIQPGGSIRDKQVIEWAAANDVVMLLAGIRHFRH